MVVLLDHAGNAKGAGIGGMDGIGGLEGIGGMEAWRV